MRIIIKCISVMTVLTVLSACKGSRQNIEEALSDMTNLYPTEKISDFYNMEGIRDERFSEDDRGVWIISTRIVGRDKEDRYIEEGMYLWINRNYEMAEGEYIINEYSSGRLIKEESYAVGFENDDLIVLDDVDEDLKEKVENFKFGLQYLNFQPDYLSGLEARDVTYNAKAPLYNITYDLECEDENLKTILSQYDDRNIKLENPALYISGSGKMDGTGMGRRSLEVVLNEEREISLISSVKFNPGKEN